MPVDFLASLRHKVYSPASDAPAGSSDMEKAMHELGAVMDMARPAGMDAEMRIVVNAMDGLQLKGSGGEAWIDFRS